MGNLPSTMRVGLIIPTYNAGPLWERVLSAIAAQQRQPDRKLIIDSASRDQTPALARAAGFEVLAIDQSSFDQGGTRQLGAELCADCDVLIYMTQDVVLANAEAFTYLIAAFDDPQVAVAYGRQLPREGATPIEAHARAFNYPAVSNFRELADAQQLGFKAAFCSDAFGAYRRAALLESGGFPARIIFGEDSYAAATLLLRDWKIAYCAEAQALHSHDYSVAEEFRRYFDIGVFHKAESWILGKFGLPTQEGRRFVLSELASLRHTAPTLIPEAMLRTLAKWLGYQFGQREHWFTSRLKRSLSMNRGHWT
jgi:rhamnosyltransferase